MADPNVLNEPEPGCPPFPRSANGRSWGGTWLGAPTYEEAGEIVYSWDDANIHYPVPCEVCHAPITGYRFLWMVMADWPGDDQPVDYGYACQESCGRTLLQRIHHRLCWNWAEKQKRPRGWKYQLKVPEEGASI